MRKFQMPKRNVNKKQQQSYLKVRIAVPDGTSAEVMTEIIDVLKKTPFNKVSVPVSTYRYLIEDNIADDDNRVITVGYIKKFDPETECFDVVIFSGNRPLIEAFENPALELVFSEYNGKLGVITKFNVVPLGEDDYDIEEETETTTAPVEESAVEYTESAE